MTARHTEALSRLDALEKDLAAMTLPPMPSLPNAHKALDGVLRYHLDAIRHALMDHAECTTQGLPGYGVTPAPHMPERGEWAAPTTVTPEYRGSPLRKPGYNPTDPDLAAQRAHVLDSYLHTSKHDR